MGALIKAPVLKEGSMNLLPQRPRDFKPVPPKAVPMEAAPAAALAAVTSATPPDRKELGAQQQGVRGRTKELVDEMAESADANYEEALRERLKVQEVLLAEIRERATVDAFAEGLEKGRQAGAQEYAERIDAFDRLLHSGRESLSAVLQESEEVIGAIVFESVCKIVGRTLASSESCALVVKEIVARVARDEVITVHVSPRDLVHFENGIDPPVTFPGVSIEADETVELGGCLLTLKGGSIDGRIETQFRSLALSLKDAARR